MISLPYSKNKRYLSGIDWFLCGLDHSLKALTGSGNLFSVALELEGFCDAGPLKENLEKYFAGYPLLVGKPSRCWNLAPYWKIPKNPCISWGFKQHQLDEGLSFDRTLEALSLGVNTAFSRDDEHVRVSLFTLRQKSYLVFVFDHRLFDARGAEMFIAGLQAHFEGKPVTAAQPREPAHLDRWADKFLAGQRVNRFFIKFRQKGRASGFDLPRLVGARRSRFKVLSLSLEETDRVIKNADARAGYLLLMPFALAASIRSTARLFAKQGISRTHCLVPVTIDTRSRAKVGKEMFFNHASFMFFGFEAGDIKDFSGLIAKASRQFYDMVQSGLSRDIKDAAMLMRIAPLRFLARFLKLSLNEQTASLAFSYNGDGVYAEKEFFGHKVLNLMHLPRVPVPPGLGIFFTRFGGRLNLVVSYLDGLVDDADVAVLAEDIKKELLQG